MELTPHALLITGLPASGKSTLAASLQVRTGLTTISKDEIKESLFDSLGYSDRAWSQKVGGASFELLYFAIRKMAATGASFIVDCDFSDPVRAERGFRDALIDYRLLNIHVSCDGEELLKRFQERSLSGERHPGHVDDTNVDEFRDMLLNGTRPRLEWVHDCIEYDSIQDEPSALMQKVEEWIQQRST